MAPCPQGPFGRGFQGQTKTDSPRDVSAAFEDGHRLAAQSAYGEVEPKCLVSEVTLEVSPSRHVSSVLSGDVLTAVTSDIWSVFCHGLRTDPHPRPPRSHQRLAPGNRALDHILPSRSLRLPRAHHLPTSTCFCDCTATSCGCLRQHRDRPGRIPPSGGEGALQKEEGVVVRSLGHPWLPAPWLQPGEWTIPGVSHRHLPVQTLQEKTALLSLVQGLPPPLLIFGVILILVSQTQ